MKKLVYLILSISFIIASCASEDEPLTTDNDCPPNLSCTEIFVSLTFSPKDGNNQPIILDSFYSQNLDNGNTYSIQNTNVSTQNSYVVITDAFIEEIQKKGTQIRFIGLIGNQIMVQQDFLIGHDCCHVEGLDGPLDQ